MQIDRRNFLQLSAGFCLASALPSVTLANEDTDSLLKIESTTIKVGATKPFKALHISDTHLTYADERNDERKRELAKSRRGLFGETTPMLDASIAHAQKNNELLIHTGDLTDFVSEQNLDVVREKFGADFDRIVSTGNHEFSQYMGEAPETEEYKQQSFPKVQNAYPNNLAYYSKVVNGVNFIAFDDVYFYVAEDLRDQFESDVAKGLPIVAMCHIPFYVPELFEPAIKVWRSCAHLIGVPAELIKERYAPGCVEPQTPNKTTLDFIDRLKKEPLLKAILCGHLHFSWVGKFSETATQYVVGGNYNGTAREIIFE